MPDTPKPRSPESRALEMLTSRLNTVLRAARIGIYERDVSGDDLWWNEGMYQLFERAPASFDPRDGRWLTCVHPEDLDRVRSSSSGPLEAGTIRELKFRIVFPGGETRHVESIEGNAADSRIVGLLMDVTVRTEAEARERELQQQLLHSSHRAAVAEIATGVLHNVANVVNGIGVANAAAVQHIRALRLERLQQASASLLEHRETLGAFVTSDPRGRHMLAYLAELSAHMNAQIQKVAVELDATRALVDHLHQVVSAQQSAALFGGLLAPCNLEEILEDSLRLQVRDQHHIEIQREYQALPPVVTDRHKLVQIVANLLSNARDAMNATGSGGLLRVSLFRDEGDAVIDIEDSGVGMSAEVLAKLWCFGFTTKPGGHGFGLHYCAKAAREIGAIITAHSEGCGHGSRFIIRLPMIRPTQRTGGT